MIQNTISHTTSNEFFFSDHSERNEERKKNDDQEMRKSIFLPIFIFVLEKKKTKASTRFLFIQWRKRDWTYHNSEYLCRSIFWRIVRVTCVHWTASIRRILWCTSAEQIVNWLKTKFDLFLIEMIDFSLFHLDNFQHFLSIDASIRVNVVHFKSPFEFFLRIPFGLKKQRKEEKKSTNDDSNEFVRCSLPVMLMAIKNSLENKTS